MKVKPGYLTTEWWITVVLTALASIVAMVPTDRVEYKIIMAILAAAGVFSYNISRGVVKRGTDDTSS